MNSDQFRFENFEAWWSSLSEEDRYIFNADGRAYPREKNEMMRKAFAAARLLKKKP